MEFDNLVLWLDNLTLLYQSKDDVKYVNFYGISLACSVFRYSIFNSMQKSYVTSKSITLPNRSFYLGRMTKKNTNALLYAISLHIYLLYMW